MNFRVHFEGNDRIFAAPSDSASVPKVVSGLASGRERIMACLGLDFSLSLTVVLAPDRAVFDCFAAPYTRVPTTPDRIACPQFNELVLLSPQCWERDAACYSNLSFFPRAGGDRDGLFRMFLWHELTHMAEEFFSPKGAMEVRPAWWSEGLAMLVAGQTEDVPIRNEISKVLAGLSEPDFLKLAEEKPYHWGWTMVRLLRERLDEEALREAIITKMLRNPIDEMGLSMTSLGPLWMDLVRNECGH